MAEKKLQEALASVNLVELIGEHHTLISRGKDYVCLCPFHRETTPSFHVDKYRYHCFGCGQHGNAIDWLVQARGFSFSEALNELGISRRGSANTQESGRLPHVDVESRLLQCRARLPYKHLMKALVYSKLGKLSDFAYISVLPKMDGDEIELICKVYNLDYRDYFNQIEALHVWESLISRWVGKNSLTPAKSF